MSINKPKPDTTPPHGGDVYHLARSLGLELGDLLDYSANINPLGFPPGIPEAIQQALGEIVHYPDRRCLELRRELAAYHHLSPEQILISDTLHQAVAATGRFRFQLAGKFALKGKAEASDLYEVVWRDEAGVLVSSHSMVMAAFDAPQIKYKLVQVRTDGRPGREFEVSREAVVGRTQGDVTFPNDEYMQPAHARLLVDSGQLFVEPMPEADSFFSLVGSFRLQHGDVVSFGSQVLEFRVDEAALAAASCTGTGLGELNAMLHGAVAEFVSLNPDAKRYPIREQQTTWGRTKEREFRLLLANLADQINRSGPANAGWQNDKYDRVY